MSKRTRQLIALFSVSFSSVPCLGQAGRAELFGTIQDPTGLAVPKAKLKRTTRPPWSGIPLNPASRRQIRRSPAHHQIVTLAVQRNKIQAEGSRSIWAGSS
jgi:hypothetical protein